MLQSSGRKRVERMRNMIEQFNQLEVKVNGKEVTIDPDRFIEEHEGKTIGRPHLGQELVARGVVDSLQQAFEQYLGDDQPCYQPVPRPGFEQVVTKIHQAQGLAVLAHPCYYNWDLPQFKRQLEVMSDLGLDGIEVFYPYRTIKRDKKLQLPPQQIAPEANKHRLLTTGGSDFHSFEDTQLGSANVDYSCLQAMKDKLDL